MMTTHTSGTIRETRPADLTALAELHVAAFKETHGRFGAPSYQLRLSQWRAAFDAGTDWCCFVAEGERGDLVGFAKGTRHDGGVPGFAGELNKLYVLRRWHRHGLGRRLVGRVARRFLEEGVTSMLLFGDARSSSNGFYERLGAERLLGAQGEFHGGYGWRDLHRLALACPAE
jgi:GNAT superfamily N-acetyltransferase